MLVPFSAKNEILGRIIMKALIVDDDATIREFLAELLEAAFQLSCTKASGLPEAMKEIGRNGGFDLVISDIEMPNEGEKAEGWGLAKFLQENFPRMPLLLVSGRSSLDGRSFQELAAQKDAIFLQKPFSIAALEVMVRAAFKLKGREFRPDS